MSWPRAIPEDNFRQVLPAGGWDITYLGPTTYRANMNLETFEMMAASSPDFASTLQPLLERLRVIEPILVNG